MDKQPYIPPQQENCAPDDKQHIRLSYITNYYLNQKSADSITDLLTVYLQYDPELLSQIQFVIVDDGSPIQVQIPDFDLNIIWLRITEDIMWNLAGARNLGVLYAKSDKILMTDSDIEYPEHTLRKMAEMRNPGRHFYRIRRRNFVDEKTGKVGRPGANNFFMSRARFMRFYGYEEEFNGGYGSEDYRFTRIQKYHGSWLHKLPKKYYCRYREELDSAPAHHSLPRDGSRNTQIDIRKRSELLYWGAESGHSRRFLDFPWEIQLTRNMTRKPTRASKRWWKHLWWFRVLFRTW